MFLLLLVFAVPLFMLPPAMLVFDLPPFMFPPMFMLPPPFMFPAGVMVGVAVLVAVGEGVAVLVLFVVVVLVLVSLPPQPIPRAATASKVRRAKVLRIELSPVTQRGQIVRELKRKLLVGLTLEGFCLNSVNCSNHSVSTFFSLRSTLQKADCTGQLIFQNR